MRHFSDGFDRSLLIGKQAEHVVIGLLARCKGGTGSCAVSHVTVGRVGHHQTGIGELGKAERLETVLALNILKVILNAHYLVGAHAVTDKIEHILGSLLGRCRNDQKQHGQEQCNSLSHRLALI